MRERFGLWMGWKAALLACLVCSTGAACAQKAAAVPQLDLHEFLKSWHVQAWMPTKAEKQCTANLDILYAVGDGAHAFQTGTFCQVKNGNAQEWNGTGKTDKAGTGKWKLRRFLFFSSPYWVLAVGPEYRWALVGTPNHKKLWVLSKGAVMAPELLAEIEKQAAAQGYDLAKLVKAPGDAEAL